MITQPSLSVLVDRMKEEHASDLPYPSAEMSRVLQRPSAQVMPAALTAIEVFELSIILTESDIAVLPEVFVYMCPSESDTRADEHAVSMLIEGPVKENK